MNRVRINILYVYPALLLGGSEKQLYILLRHLDRRRYHPYVCCLLREGAVAGMIRGLGIEVINASLPSIYDVRAVGKIYRILKEKQIDIVQTCLFGFDLYTHIAARLSGVKGIISLRREIAVWKKPHHIIMQRIANMLADTVVANSRAVKDAAVCQERLPADRIMTICNGVEESAWTVLEPAGAARDELKLLKTDCVVGMISNFGALKGHRYFLDAARIIIGRRQQVSFVLAGSGPRREDAVAYARELRIDQHIRFVDSRPDVSKILAAFDIFAFSSIIEGFPNAVLEAMAAGLPVVATRVGGIPEIIDTEDKGILVEPRNAEELARAVERLIDDPGLRAAIGKSGQRSVIKRYAASRMAAAYAGLYERAAAGNNGETISA
jgi:glycosyltransferase involved in cell wall biosynthesis